MGPETEFAEYLHAQKYRGEGESFREAMNRVASTLSDNQDHYHRFREILHDMRFLPGGRIQSAIGSIKNVTPYNCFVSGVIEDSFVEGSGSIMNRAKEAAATMRMGGGIGYDFSSLRPRGATIKKLQSRSSGPISFMQIFDSICRCVASSGHRRGAQMGILRIDHPDIEEFVRAKQNGHNLTGFNLSVAVTDEFMKCLREGRDFPLRFNGEVYSVVKPELLWNMIMRSTYDWGEPGILFIDTINRMNNLQYCETIAATNPCGELPLPGFGACLLGSFNLPKYIYHDGQGYAFNWAQLKVDIPIVVRAMDNVPENAVFPLYEQEKEAKAKRRMGLGVTGLANALEVLGYPYGSDEFIDCQNHVFMVLCRNLYFASINLAAEKGPFPAYSEKYLHSLFVNSQLTEEHIDLMRKFGIRNSHLLAIAPTGTISMCADNVSSGIEPVFDYEVQRTLVEFEKDREVVQQDYAFRTWGVLGKRVTDVTIEEHLTVLALATQWVDSSVSKTCNVPTDIDWEEFKNIYIQAWELGCKGCTTYRIGGKRAPLLKTSCKIDEKTGKKDCE